MRKVYTLLTALLLILCLNGCSSDSNGPADFPNSKWVCSNPSIWFQVDNNNQSKGQVNIDGKVTKMEIGFRNRFVCIFTENDTTGEPKTLLDGSGTFNKDKMIIKVSDDDIFNNKYKELVFIKEGNK